jgi:porphobilinogen synthase
MSTTARGTQLNLTRRLRRLRRTPAMRGLVREARLSPDQFILPLFVTDRSTLSGASGTGRREVSSMPGVCQMSVEEAVNESRAAWADGVPAVLLFGLPPHKDDIGSGAYDAKGPVQEAVRAIRRDVPQIVVITDVCLCEYTSHGHCGVITDGDIANDATVELLARSALSHAQAGAHIVAPSDMMDGRVAAIRAALDERGFDQVAIMAYAAKYCSGFYGPFREAADSAPQRCDRRGYQMDPANAREALREVALDAAEGADVVMVKPALPYLDVIRRVRESTDLPVAAYNVSGEYAMVKSAAAHGLLDERAAVLEGLTGIRRAGADIIFTYHAKDVAKWLR